MVLKLRWKEGGEKGIEAINYINGELQMKKKGEKRKVRDIICLLMSSAWEKQNIEGENPYPNSHADLRFTLKSHGCTMLILEIEIIVVQAASSNVSIYSLSYLTASDFLSEELISFTKDVMHQIITYSWKKKWRFLIATKLLHIIYIEINCNRCDIHNVYHHRTKTNNN